MKTYSIVTTFNQAGRDLYGQRMIDSFDQYWPKNVKLYVYTEGCDIKCPSDRVIQVDLASASPNLVAFKERHKNNPRAHGQVLPDGSGPPKDNAFKWNAVRFAHKVFAVIHAVRTICDDWVIWLDADTVTHTAVPETFLQEICDDSAMACYLGRRRSYHSECGWVAYNRRHTDLLNFIQIWEDYYVTDTIFREQEWHDSFMFDLVRLRFQARGTKFSNISPAEAHRMPGKGINHPFIASRLGEYMDHMKGHKRKALGHSLADDIVRNKGLGVESTYWKNIFNQG